MSSGYGRSVSGYNTGGSIVSTLAANRFRGANNLDLTFIKGKFMSTLFHFTALAYLPAIRREGIKRGEFPDPALPYHERPQWPNLTNVRDPKKHTLWNVSGFDKTRVRIEVDTGLLTIRSFDELCEEYELPKHYVKALAPKGENRTWFHSIGPVPTTSFVGIEIALEQPFRYRCLCDEHIEALCQHVEAHFAEHFTLSEIPGGRVSFNHPTSREQCWLLDSTQFIDELKGKYRPLPKKWRKKL